VEDFLRAFIWARRLVLQHVQLCNASKSDCFNDEGLANSTLSSAYCACRNYTPSVIEPSFGVGRILYCLFEHAFYAREGTACLAALHPPWHFVTDVVVKECTVDTHFNL
jgi:glycyl-tRNA synthetase (class II)